MKGFSLLILLVMSILSACSNNQSSNEQSSQDLKKSESEGFKNGKFEPAVTISTAHCNNNVPFREGESIEDNVHTRWAKEELGLKIEYDWTTKLNKSWQSVSLLVEQKNESIQDLYMGAPTETMTAKGEALRTLEIETFISIIYGKTPVSEFDTFVKKWKEMGVDKITEEVNEWYNSATSNYL